MRTTDENIELSRPVTLRVLQVMDTVLSNPLLYKVLSIRAFAHSIGLESTHIYAFKENENRNVTLVVCIKLCKVYGISPNWLLLNIGPQKLKKDKEEISLEKRLEAVEQQLKLKKRK